MAEGSKSTDNGKEFLIMNSVITLGRLEGLGKVSNRVPTIEKVRLFQDSASGKITGICDELKGLGVIRQGKDRSLGKLANECGERSLMCQSPLEGSILQGQVKEGACDGRVISNKVTIEVAET